MSSLTDRLRAEAPVTLSDTAELLNKAADVIDELTQALEILTDHAQERYPHFEYARGQRDIAAALAAIAKARGLLATSRSKKGNE